MALALAQHVGGARHVDEGRVADLRAVGADGQEEVRFVGRRIAGIHAHFHGVAGLVRLERDALHVILQEQRDVREDGCQLARGIPRNRIRARETDWRPAGPRDSV